MDDVPCIIASLPNEDCKKDFFTRSCRTHKLSDLSENDLKLLQWRVPGVLITKDDMICAYHKYIFLDDYSSRQTKCCDPFKDHADKNRTKSLRVMTLNLCEEYLLATGSKLIPGQKFCPACRKKVNSKFHEKTTVTNTTQSTETEPMGCELIPKPEVEPASQTSNVTLTQSSVASTSSGSVFVTDSQEYLEKTRVLKRMLDGFGLPIPTRHALSSERFEKEVAKTAISAHTSLVQELNSVLGTRVKSLELSEDSSSLRAMISNLKNKYESVSNVSEKISLLTLLPSEWSKPKIQQNFKCSDYMIRKAKMLRETQGCLPGPSKRKSNYIHSQEIKDSITEFYRDDRNSRICAGTSEYKRVNDEDQNKKVKVQRRLLLYDLKDLYKMWLESESEKFQTVPGFTFFTMMRPLECVPAGDPSTHKVCVCAQHQNVKLKLQALSSSISYKDVLEICVCSTENPDCMLHKCRNCPGKDAIGQYFQRQEFYGSKESINYMCWKTTEIDQSARKSSRVDQSQKKTTEIKPSGGKAPKIIPKRGKAPKIIPKGGKAPKIRTKGAKATKIKPSEGKATKIEPSGEKATKSNKGGGESMKENQGEGKESTLTRVTLEKVTEKAEVFYEKLIDDLWKLTEHQYITESQKNSFYDQKENLNWLTLLIIMDFAENYTFIAQDSVQAFYFNNIQATLYPVVIYFRRHEGAPLEVLSLCIISDHMKHDASTVNLFQEKIMKEIKILFPWIKRIIYWTDGAPNQFKNKNYFSNLCNHQKDFGVEVETHNFLSTSHGKNACDGIGATVKRMVRRASLQLPPEQQILTPHRMYQYLSEHEKSTRFIWASSAECTERANQLQARYLSAKTVTHTRDFHCVKPLDSSTAQFKIVSSNGLPKTVKFVNG
ncbi:hypothetical protein QAD02_022356 [Eretmocerus hayati]|uniref:Uncharacterized protein n=1 Tax=Eretmocerus hayati TaxID=131215 RepID=A0ACC2PW29_9HYME|nr:hypothetical protein QAD02_022356 [Eretmocerus hayati]